MTDGIYTVPFEQYESVDAASKHGLDALGISPLHFWAYYKNPLRGPQKSTPARELGNALHVAILEPERFEKEFVCEPDIKDYSGALDLAEDYKRAAKELSLPVSGTKPVLKNAIISASSKYKFWDDIYEAVTKGKKILSIPDWKICRAITHRVRKHPAASELFKSGSAEQSIFWTDRDTGVSCKGRIDWLTTGSEGGIIVDLKSTTDASPEGFQRSVSKYRYYIQAAMYTDGLEALGYPVEAFIFAAWEKHSPYASALYYPNQEMLVAGRQEYKRLLRVYKKCVEEDSWPGYSIDVMPISLPDNYKGSPLMDEEDWISEMTGTV